MKLQTPALLPCRQSTAPDNTLHPRGATAAKPCPRVLQVAADEVTQPALAAPGPQGRSGALIRADAAR